MSMYILIFPPKRGAGSMGVRQITEKLEYLGKP